MHKHKIWELINFCSNKNTFEPQEMFIIKGVWNFHGNPSYPFWIIVTSYCCPVVIVQKLFVSEYYSNRNTTKLFKMAI